MISEKHIPPMPDSAALSDEPPQHGFKRLDLSIAYQALIESFVRSDDAPLPNEKMRQPDWEVYDNS